MKSRSWRCRAMMMGSAWGAEAPSCTITMAAVVAATCARVCITMHNWQLSASVELE
jgi:hypothetical protein